MPFFNSLFWQLYLSILGALVLIALLFVGMLDYTSAQMDAEDFYRDVQEVSKPIILAWRKTRQLDPQLVRLARDENLFQISVLDDKAFQKQLIAYEALKTIHRTHIYQALESDLLLSAQRLPKSSHWLLVSDIDPATAPYTEDMNEHVRQRFEQELREGSREELREESQTRSILQLSVIGLLLIIGAVLMVLVRRISRHVEGLTSVSNQWASGKLSITANTNVPAPLDQLAHGLNQMAGELNQTLSEQQVMTHAISHELRTPLSKLQLALSLLERKYSVLQNEPLTDDLQRYIDELEYLVNQILTFAKLNHLKEQHSIETVNMSKLLEERVAESKALNTNKTISLSCPEDIQFIGKAFNLQLALDNVLKNALKYCKQSVQVLVQIVMTQDSNPKQLHIIIEDDGPGIPVEQRQTILMPFARVDESRNRESGGYGLGLAIVDAIVRHYGGEIQLAESALGGLAITLVLPLYRHKKKP